jgi:hypothetical protein
MHREYELYDAIYNNLRENAQWMGFVFMCVICILWFFLSCDMYFVIFSFLWYVFYFVIILVYLITIK